MKNAKGRSKDKLNWRDVGVALRELNGGTEVITSGWLFRCGNMDYSTKRELRGSETVINLRQVADLGSQQQPRAASSSSSANRNRWMAGEDAKEWLHCPVSKKVDKYDTTLPQVREWLATVMNIFEREDLHFPVLIHCAKGRDRTGVVVATLLRILGVPRSLIVQEYLLTSGTHESSILTTLDGIEAASNGGSIEKYFRKKVNVAKIRRNLSSRVVSSSSSSSCSSSSCFSSCSSSSS
ncbi:hypothetical protein QOT17_001490 [Balamuthia mandrillaris]